MSNKTAADNTTVVIHLLDREYRVSCSPSEQDDLRRAALFLDDKLKEVKSAQVLGLDRIAVITALNLANDLLKANQKIDQQTDQQERLSQLSERINSEIDAFNTYRNELL